MYESVLTFVGSPEATRKEMRKAVKPELAETLVEWHEKFLPVHFTVRGHFAYRYQMRDARYVKIKRRKLGHNRPLVWSGRMERMLTRMLRISGTAKRATGRMTGPKYLYQYRKDLGQPDKHDEVTRTTPGELLKLAKSFDERITSRLNGVTTRETYK